MARKAAIRHPDFTIVFRQDRNGYEGWHSGKAEAFRPTVEKVNLFFQKKYGKTGALLTAVLPSGSIVREYKLPEAEPKKLAKAHAVAAVKAAKAKAAKTPKVMEFEPETFESEDRLDRSDLDALL